MIERLKGRENLIKFTLLLIALAGGYFCVAWASYSPLDNAWTVASSVTQDTLNKTGSLGAWVIDLLFAMFGKMAFLIPFAFTFVPIFLLVLRACDDLNLRQAVLWLLSFTIFMVGLSGLASVLLPNSAAYLSGGFIGAMLSELIGNRLGQIGVLFLSMVITAGGFYFCSGQILIRLLGRLYDWIMDNKEHQAILPERQAVSSEQHFANQENDEIVEKEITVSPENPLTDVTQFARPKITGLKPEAAEQRETNECIETTMYRVETQTELPKVSVPAFSPVSSTQQQVQQETLETFEPMVDERHFPTIRLNPESSTVQAEPEPTDLQNSDVISPLAMPSEVDQLATSVKKEEQHPEFLKPNVKVELPEPVEKERQAVSSEPNFTKPKAATPVIHPLLQRQTTTEKPTTPLPTNDLLSRGKQEIQQITEQEIRETSARIEQELANFGVKATVEDVLVGPVVTRYEIQPAAGVKASKISNLGSDLARSLIFEAIRITDVVPGKPFMGIETPNRQRETVWLRDVLDSDAFRHSNATLPMALGKDISGKPVVVDMAKMPHLLVAGQTGGGKSVGVNTMILSLLFKLTPEQVRFIMIDPKVVELSVYNDIPHLLTPVVTDMKKAENALRWAVEEMEHRYQLVSYLQVRNIEGYNNKIEQAEAMGIPITNPHWKPTDSMDLTAPPLKKMSYIVLIVDEFADLMMSAGKQVEDHIMRIAQKARAVGIHLILATQRPSTDVITGVIKANIPSRIAFTVASQIDSRTILDKGGAEALLGRGDMLYSGAGSPEMIRVHGAFMTDEDVLRVADNWRARGKPEYIDSIIESADDEDVDGSQRGALGDLDPLFDEIAGFVVESNITSISGIQRRFSLGFNRAARIVDQLEAQGILSAPDAKGKREVLAR
ncbi:cell division protein FtsK [Pasteurellaceae bacterium Orientalotternb1]|nr:cell division protein FtsK [Pasteurellaceae bacterium Orientalotternb1]